MSNAVEVEAKVITEEIPQPIQTDMTPTEMVIYALQKGFSAEILGKLMEREKRFIEDEKKKEFVDAVSAAHNEMPVILKENKGYNYKYEDFASIAIIIDPILKRHGLSYRFDTVNDKELVTITCILSHANGHSEKNSLSAPPDIGVSRGKDPNYNHALGSTTTYFFRYTLKACLGLIVAKDDDGTYARYNAAKSAIANNDIPANDNSPVSPQQLLEIKKLMAENNLSEKPFCEYLKIEKLEELHAIKFEKVISQLTRRLQRKMEEQQMEEAHA